MDQLSNQSQISMDGIPDYQTANHDLRIVMDDIMSVIDPNDVGTILSFGKEPAERLGAVADQVMRRSGANNSLMSTFDSLQEEISDLDIGSLATKAMNLGAKGAGWMVKNPGTALTTVAASVFLSPFALFLPIAKNRLDRFKAKQNGGDFTDDLRKSVAQSDHVIEKLTDAGNAIPKEIESLNELGQARADSYQQVSLYIGAAIERQRRLNQEEIPALRKSLEERYDYENDIRLQNYSMSSEELAVRINSMLGSRLVSQAAMVTLMRLKGIFAQAAGKVQSHLDISVPQWKAQMAESGVLLTAHKVTSAINEADEFGTKVFVQGAAVADKTAQLMSRSLRSGTYDPEKLIGVLKDMTGSLQRDVALISSRRSDLEADRKRLSDASTAFRESVVRIANNADNRMALPTAQPAPLALENRSPN